jgi:hypothetical protein
MNPYGRGGGGFFDKKSSTAFSGILHKRPGVHIELGASGGPDSFKKIISASVFNTGRSSRYSFFRWNFDCLKNKTCCKV